MHVPVERTRLRALIDAAVAVLGSAGIGWVLISFNDESSIINLAAMGAGLLLVTVAALSVVRRQPVFSTPADRVTLVRAVLVGGCATIVTLSLFDTVPSRSWWLIGLAAPALLLDAVDGWVARRTGTATAQGARLDMETDAAFLLVLSIPAAFVIGPWVLAIGAMRYLFAAASWWRPALRQHLSFSSFRRVTAGVQGFVLLFVLIPTVPLALAVPITVFALVLLMISFGKDAVLLERSFRDARMTLNQPRDPGSATPSSTNRGQGQSAARSRPRGDVEIP